MRVWLQLENSINAVKRLDPLYGIMISLQTFMLRKYKLRSDHRMSSLPMHTYAIPSPTFPSVPSFLPRSRILLPSMRPLKPLF